MIANNLKRKKKSLGASIFAVALTLVLSNCFGLLRLNEISADESKEDKYAKTTLTVTGEGEENQASLRLGGFLGKPTELRHNKGISLLVSLADENRIVNIPYRGDVRGIIVNIPFREESFLDGKHKFKIEIKDNTLGGNNTLYLSTKDGILKKEFAQQLQKTKSFDEEKEEAEKLKESEPSMPPAASAPSPAPQTPPQDSGSEAPKAGDAGQANGQAGPKPDAKAESPSAPGQDMPEKAPEKKQDEDGKLDGQAGKPAEKEGPDSKESPESKQESPDTKKEGETMSPSPKPEKETDPKQQDPSSPEAGKSEEAPSSPKVDKEEAPSAPSVPEKKEEPSEKQKPEAKPQPEVKPSSSIFLNLATTKDLTKEARTTSGKIKVNVDEESAKLVGAKEIEIKGHSYAKTAGFNPLNHELYDISLLDKNGNKITEFKRGFEAEVLLPVKSGREVLAVKHFLDPKDSTKQEKVPSEEVEIAGQKYRKIKVSHFSVYGIEYKPVTDGKDKLPNTGASAGATSALVMLMGLGIAFFTKKK